jgi:hypothetical protein
MKNTINIGRQPETISPHELADAMQAGRAYSQDEVMSLLPGRPRARVRDTLHLMVQKGMIWRNNSKRGAITFELLEGEQLREAIDSKTKRLDVPDWMKNNLVDYERSQNGFRDLCLLARK